MSSWAVCKALVSVLPHDIPRLTGRAIIAAFVERTGRAVVWTLVTRSLCKLSGCITVVDEISSIWTGAVRIRISAIGWADGSDNLWLKVSAESAFAKVTVRQRVSWGALQTLTKTWCSADHTVVVLTDWRAVLWVSEVTHITLTTAGTVDLRDSMSVFLTGETVTWILCCTCGTALITDV